MSNPFYLNQQSAENFLKNPHKAITLLGMSGVGKTTLANSLPSSNWFKYSGDYRLGTRYLDEAILDNIKRKAMQIPFLADLLKTDSIYICHNITINNLYPVSSFLGKVGNPKMDGLTIDEFLKRQQMHHDAEVQAMLDVPTFIDKGQNIYGYPNFINDAGGSLSELNDPSIFKMLANHTLIVYLKATGNMVNELINRSISEPKPMYYQTEFFLKKIKEYSDLNRIDSEQQINPDDFIKWVFIYLIEDRIPRYQKIADEYGITIDASIVETINNEEDFLQLIAEALKQKNS